MTDTTHSTPSAKQLLALAKQVPSVKPPAPPVARNLHDLVDICRAKWIRDFLFTIDPIHVPYFTSPTFGNAAFACHHSATHAEPPKPQPDGNLSGETRHHEGHLLFLPAFTAEQVTVGFGVMESELTYGTPWMLEGNASESMRLNFRFVRDASRGALLMIYSVPDRDFFLIRYYKLESPTCSHYFEVKLGRCQPLESIQARDGNLSTQQLLMNLHFFNDEYQYRPCFVCGSPPSVFCGCFSPIPYPAHPFDNQFVTSAMSQHLGSYVSIASKVYGAPGPDQRHVVLAARRSCQGISDPVMIERLKVWTLAEHARTVKEHPWQMSSLNGAYLECSGDVYRREEETNPFGIGTIAFDDSTDDSPTTRAVDLSNGFIPYLPDPCMGTDDNNLGLGTSRSINPLETLVDEPLGNIIGASVYRDEKYDNKSTTYPMESGGSGPHANLTGRGGNTARCEAVLYTQGQNSGNVVSAGRLPIERALKFELRKIRNRASARRSNHRKKVRREWLQLELRKSYDKLAQLRKADLKLRKENLWLKAECRKANLLL